ncbi:Hypothetical protein PBC10988_3670 [Planctomycetales bacterium 10988]|nr:Hypothetical protein PBC10988_3670 [Planctomycetales bacterium 10988]
MSWDTKRNGKSYYYRNKRVDGRPVKEYLGSGKKAKAAAQEDCERRLQRVRDREYWDQQLSSFEEADQLLQQLSEGITLVFRAVLIREGFYLHKGHEWRKRRKKKMSEENKPSPEEEVREAFRRTVEKANAGNERALRVMKKYLDLHPELWKNLGDLSKVAEEAWLNLCAQEDVLSKEVLRRQLAALKEEILDGSESILEKLLTETVVSTWMELQYLRCVDADPTPRNTGQTSILVKRLESADRRMQTGIKQLVQLRRRLPNKTIAPALKIYNQSKVG